MRGRDSKIVGERAGCLSIGLGIEGRQKSGVDGVFIQC